MNEIIKYHDHTKSIITYKSWMLMSTGVGDGVGWRTPAFADG